MSRTASRITRAIRLGIVGSITAAALVLTGCAAGTQPAPTASGAPEPIHLRVAYGNAAANYLNMYVAWKEGIFKKNGLDVDEPFNAQASGAVGVLLSGDADVIVEGGPQVLTAVAAGADLKILGSTVNKYTFVVVAPNSVKNLSDLKGKKLAVSAPGGSVSRAAEVLLAEKKLTNNVQLQNIADLPTRLAALQQGQVDAIVISPPVNSLIKTGDYHIIYDMTQDTKLEALLTSIATTGDFLKKNPEALRRFILSLYQAEQWIRDPANNHEVMKDLQALTGTADPDALKEGLDYQEKAGEPKLQFSNQALANSIEQVEDSANVKIDAKKVVDLKILTNVLKSVGVDKVSRD
jgi:NitT/TauT family transport system substrate-binding protein